MASPAIWRAMTRVGFAVQAAAAPRGPLSGAATSAKPDHDHGPEHPAPDVAQEVVGDPDDRVVLDPDRPAVETAVVRMQDDAGPDEQPRQRHDERRHAGLGDDERLEKPIVVVSRSATPIASHQGQPGSSGRRRSVITTPPTALT